MMGTTYESYEATMLRCFSQENASLRLRIEALDQQQRLAGTEVISSHSLPSLPTSTMAFEAPIYNPPIPFVGFISGGMTSGKMMYIQGNVPHHCSRFSINLTNAGIEQGDYIFHFNPRFTENQVVRGAKLGGAWGAEERHGHFPFRKGENFEIIIYAQNDAYKVAVNGHHYCDFRHRVPMQRVTQYTIEGEVMIHTIRFQGGVPTGWGGGFTYGNFGDSARNPPVPYGAMVPGGLQPGKMITISGSTTMENRFSVNLVTGPDFHCHDVGFHFNPRFEENAVVRGSRMGGSWGPEERHMPFFPFMRNTHFEMMILVDPHQIKVAVNGQHFIDFPHRIQPMQRLNFLWIEGGVRLHEVRIY